MGLLKMDLDKIGAAVRVSNSPDLAPMRVIWKEERTRALESLARGPANEPHVMAHLQGQIFQLDRLVMNADELKRLLVSKAEDIAKLAEKLQAIERVQPVRSPA